MTTKISGIYKITNTINGNCYISSAVNIHSRWKAHVKGLNKNKHHSQKLQNAWNKYGEPSFEFSVLEECEAKRDVLLGREQYWIDTFSAASRRNYNMLPTAGSQMGVKQSPETIALRVEKNTGQKRTEETIRRMSISQSNRSPETRALISKNKREYWARVGVESMLGENNHFYGKGKPLTQEHKDKVSASLKMRLDNPETRAKRALDIKNRPQELVDQIAEKNRGRKRSPESVLRMKAAQQNRSEETNKKNADARRGAKRSPEACERMRVARLAYLEKVKQTP
jgi:group I intron endonuclease